MLAVPAVTPVTWPKAFTDAIPAASVVHVPPGTELLSVVEKPVQTVVIPAMAPGVPGAGLTVMLTTSLADPQLLITV